MTKEKAMVHIERKKDYLKHLVEQKKQAMQFPMCSTTKAILADYDKEICEVADKLVELFNFVNA